MEKSIKQLALEHWDRIACGSNTEEPVSGSCSYCRRYLHDECNGCKIFIKTGKDSCRNTPYDGVYHQWFIRKKGKAWQANCADKIEAMIELIESLPEE